MPDIDIDFLDRKKALNVIKHIPASIRDDNGTFKKHNTGVYCQSVPYNPLTDTASIDHKLADTRGYFKIDFLNVSAYQGVRDEQHLVELLNTEPIWELLEEKDVCDKLFHINGYHQLLKELAPKSIMDLAMILAMIRPGKKHLIPQCKEQGFDAIKDEIWTKTADTYFFKKSHAHSYAVLIIVQMNLLCEDLTRGS